MESWAVSFRWSFDNERAFPQGWAEPLPVHTTLNTIGGQGASVSSPFTLNPHPPPTPQPHPTLLRPFSQLYRHVSANPCTQATCAPLPTRYLCPPLHKPPKWIPTIRNEDASHRLDTLGCRLSSFLPRRGQFFRKRGSKLFVATPG